MRIIQLIGSVMTLSIFLYGCEKYLEAKPDKRLTVISTLDDVQSLLDYYNSINYKSVAASEISAGDFYMTNNELSTREEYNRRLYLWQNDNIFSSTGSNDWFNIFYVVYTANSVLASMPRIDRNIDTVRWDDIKGQALFHRAISYMAAMFAWCSAYDSVSAATDLGLPLRLDDDFSKASVRASLEDTYQCVISDLKASIPLLPSKSIHVLRPCKAASYGLLARVYLSMRKYSEVNRYADSALSYSKYLMDFNDKTIITSVTASYPIPQFNNEILEECRFSSTMLLNTRAFIDPTFYNSYNSNDLRKTIFFKTNSDGSCGFKGSYSHSTPLCFSICTDEVYLMKAEAAARSGGLDDAIYFLNALLSKRWKTGSFVPYTVTTQQELITYILQERRKELVMRGLRWMDIKRLNKEFPTISLSRSYNGQVYSLPSNSKRFAIPIPDDIIQLSGMSQNSY